MDITVEPREGPELDRLITALLNVTGVVKRVIDDALLLPYSDGTEVMGRAAERLRGPLAFLAEHRSDEELEFVVRVLAEVTLIAAEDMGLSATFRDTG